VVSAAISSFSRKILQVVDRDSLKAMTFVSPGRRRPLGEGCQAWAEHRSCGGRITSRCREMFSVTCSWWPGGPAGGSGQRATFARSQGLERRFRQEGRRKGPQQHKGRERVFHHPRGAASLPVGARDFLRPQSDRPSEYLSHIRPKSKLRSLGQLAPEFRQ
jgi:hypothetical protein